MATDRALVDAVRRDLLASAEPPSPARLAQAVARAGVHGDRAVLTATSAVRDELVGLGPLTALVADPTVTDVVVSAPDEVWCDRGAGLERTSVRFACDDAVRRLATRLVARGGRRLDDGQPFADVALPGGLRVHAVLRPVAADATQLSVRVPARRGFDLAELVERGTIDPPMAAVLAALVRARLSFLVTGGTGSGKTTVLSALLGGADPAERVVLVEDVSELRPALPHVVRLCARPANAEGAGAVTLTALVRQTLRMRPDRIVVGEVRGGEVVDLLTAFNSGHSGGAATVHANTAGELPARVEALALAAGLPRAAAHSLLAAAVDAVVHLDRDRSWRRRVTEIGVLTRTPDGLVVVEPAYRSGLGPCAAARRLDQLLSLRGETASW